jgi:uncharacterized protein YcbK (DUF882 family)
MIYRDLQEWDFKYLKHFTLNEIKPHIKELKDVKANLIYTLEMLRDKVNAPITITSITQGTHAKNSYHYKGLAVDFKIDLTQIPRNKILQAMLDSQFKGVGIYDWGFHGDIREEYALWKFENNQYLTLV